MWYAYNGKDLNFDSRYRFQSTRSLKLCTTQYRLILKALFSPPLSLTPKSLTTQNIRLRLPLIVSKILYFSITGLKYSSALICLPVQYNLFEFQ